MIKVNSPFRKMLLEQQAHLLYADIRGGFFSKKIKSHEEAKEEVLSEFLKNNVPRQEAIRITEEVATQYNNKTAFSS